MIKIPIKTLSQNRAWQGKRFKSKMYKAYETAVMAMLPKMEIPEGKLRINFEFGFNRTNNDLDNPLKICLDILSKKYKYNDLNVYELNLKKVIVKKEQEYFSFKIEAI